jgi:prepilin-type N-terminal cleavage/methylation domain-containing protein
MPRPSTTTRHGTARTGFTIVEVLVTVGIIALLAGIIITSLRGAFGTARKTKEMNLIRGLHIAWSQYANSYEENLLPGFLDENAQASWQVTYSNASGNSLNRAFSQTYTWRLARFMDDLPGTLLSYRDTDEGVDADNATSGDWPGEPALPAWMGSVPGNPGSAIALQPGFAYNAFYLGGWYETSGSGVAAPRFADAQWTAQGGTSATRGRLVATRLANISRTTDLVVFASSTYRAPGNYRDNLGAEDTMPGCAWVVPPALGQQEVWGPYLGTPTGLDASASAAQPGEGGIASIFQSGYAESGVLGVNVAQGVPIRRYNKLVAAGKADGSVETLGIAALMDMRLWIDAADQVDFRHQNN